MRHPAALALLPLLAGAVAGLLVGEEVSSSLALVSAAGASLALLAAAGSCATGAVPEGVVSMCAGYALVGLSLGVTASQAAYRPALLAWFDSRASPQGAGPVVLEGVLREDAALSGIGPSLTLDVERVSRVAAGAVAVAAAGGVRLSVTGSMGASRTGEWRAGRRVRLTALLREPSVYFDPGVRDERRALARRGIVLVGTIKSAALIEVTAPGSRVSEAAAAVRAWTRTRLTDAVGRWSRRSAAIATAILIGDRSGLSDADTRRLQDAGTYHVIAISGGNIAILTGLLLGALSLARVPPRVAAWITIPILLAYGEVVVQSASVQRAITAAVVYLTARGLDHRGPALNVLAVAAALALAVSPIVVYDPGFLLSFGATIGILALAARVVEAAPVRPSTPAAAPVGIVRRVRLLQPVVTVGGRAIGSVWAMLRVTLAAEAALLPIAALLFARVTFAGLLFNFVAIPLMAVLQALAMLVLLASALSTRAAAVVGYGAHLAATGIVESARLTEQVPWLALDVVPPSWWLLLIYYGAAVIALIARPRAITRPAACVAAATIVVIVVGPRWAVGGIAPPAAGIRIVFLDVGQGDATAILIPGGHAMLVDAGGVASAPSTGPDEDDSGGFDIGARVVAPALRALGVRRLDALTITHGDPDHIGGAPAVLRAFHPSSVWEGVPVPPHPWLRGVSEAADALGLRWRTVQPGDVERIGPVVIKVLHPPLPDWERQRVRNEDSVVLDVRIGDVSIVLPGDIGAEGERAILAHLEPARTVVLKAPHHGSATSSTPALLAALKPSVVIFSAGRANRFGHPAPKVVARYRELGVQMLSTAEDGAIMLDTDGRDVVLRGWTGRTLTIGSAKR